MLPAYIPPLKEELFSSWIMRLSQNHLEKSHSFAKFYLSNTELWSIDIDKLMPNHLIETLLKITPLKENDIKSMFIPYYRGLYFSNHNISGITKEILTLGKYHRFRTRNGLLYCPGCLDCDIPYFKISWRITSNIICSKCNLLLYDKCLSCESPIMFHRLENGKKNQSLNHPLNVCSNCNNSLTHFKMNPIDKFQVKYQKDIEHLIQSNSTNAVKRIRFYLEVMSQINSNTKYNKLKIAFQESLSSKIDNENAFNSVKKRRVILPIIHKMFETQNSTSTFLSMHTISYSYFNDFFKNQIEMDSFLKSMSVSDISDT